MGFFSKISQGLKKTRESFSQQMDLIVNSFTAIDDDLMDELEESLIWPTWCRNCLPIIQKRGGNQRTGVTDPAQLKEMLVDIVVDMLAGDCALKLDTSPAVILVIGVNAGKTTTIGKLSCC